MDTPSGTVRRRVGRDARRRHTSTRRGGTPPPTGRAATTKKESKAGAPTPPHVPARAPSPCPAVPGQCPPGPACAAAAPPTRVPVAATEPVAAGHDTAARTQAWTKRDIPETTKKNTRPPKRTRCVSAYGTMAGGAHPPDTPTPVPNRKMESKQQDTTATAAAPHRQPLWGTYRSTGQTSLLPSPTYTTCRTFGRSCNSSAHNPAPPRPTGARVATQRRRQSGAKHTAT